MDNFASLVRHFRAEFGEYKFNVRRVPLKTDLGWCRKEESGSFSIRVRKQLEETAQLVILAHEIGHMLSWDTDNHPSDHGSRFGAAYARAWRSYQRWLSQED